MKQQKALIELDMKEACALLRHRTHDPNSKVAKRDVYNTVPLEAALTCAHGIAGYLLSPSIRWFHFATKDRNFQDSDEIEGSNDWLEQVTSLMYRIYSNSKFYSTTETALLDAIIAGTSYELVTDNVENGKLTFSCFSPFECYIDEDASGNVDTFFREYNLTAKAAVKKFGDKVPQEVKDLIEKNPNAPCQFIHAVFPRDDYKEGFTSAKSKKFASVHYSRVGDTIFDISGYDEFPLAIHRFRKVEGYAYGFGLAMDYLPEIKRLNDLTKQYNIAVQFQASPMLDAPMELKGHFTYRPGVVNYRTQNGGEIKPIQTQLNIQFLQAQIAELEARINTAFFTDLFNILMRQDRNRTAYEVSELKGEGLILLSALIGNMQDEKLNPLVLRTFRIMLRNGLLPQPPEALLDASAEGRVDIELDGPLAQTMRAYHQATGLEQGLAAIATIAQISPESTVNFDFDKIARKYAQSKGLPESCIREISERDQIKQQQAEMQAQAEQQQQAVVQSQIMKNLGYNAGNAMAMGQSTQELGSATLGI